MATRWEISTEFLFKILDQSTLQGNEIAVHQILSELLLRDQLLQVMDRLLFLYIFQVGLGDPHWPLWFLEVQTLLSKKDPCAIPRVFHLASLLAVCPKTPIVTMALGYWLSVAHLPSVRRIETERDELLFLVNEFIVNKRPIDIYWSCLREDCPSIGHTLHALAITVNPQSQEYWGLACMAILVKYRGMDSMHEHHLHVPSNDYIMNLMNEDYPEPELLLLPDPFVVPFIRDDDYVENIYEQRMVTESRTLESLLNFSM